MEIPGIPASSLRETLGLKLDLSPEEEAAALDEWFVTVADRFGRIVYAAPTFARRLGYEVDDLLGSSELRFSSNWHSEQFFRDRWETVAKGGLWNGAMICRTREGELCHFETAFRPIWSPRREILGYATIRIEVAVKEVGIDPSAACPRHILDQMTEGVAVMEADVSAPKLLFVNAALARLTGYHPRSLVGQLPDLLYGAETDFAEIGRLIKALEVGEHFATELRLYRKSGVPFWASVSISPAFDGEGELRHYTAIVHDVTVRRGLRHLRAFADSMVEALEGSLPDDEVYAEFLATLQRALTGCSFALYTRAPAGLSLHREVHTGPAENAPPETIAWSGTRPWREFARRKRHIFAVLEGLESEECPDSLKAAWREFFPASHGWFGLGMDLSAQPTLLLWITLGEREVLRETERSLLEEAMRRLIELQHRLQTRTLRSSVARKLQQSQRMEAIGTLASGIAHDFNNILGGMFGFLHLAREDVGAGHPAEEWLRQIDTACIRARDLIQQVLTFSRSEASPLQPLNPLSMVKDATRLVRASLPSFVQIELHQPNKALPRVEADPTRIQLAILNLCTNAWQSMPRGKGRIDLRFVEEERDGRRWLGLSVVDNGRGIAREIVERIREPFYSTKPTGEGTGLGLAVVQGIMDAHDGRLAVESTPGVGSTFTLFFPVIDEAEMPAPSSPPSLPRGNGERIFLLDDEVAITTWSRLILQRLGYTVETCNDPEIALAMLEREIHEFDLVIVDLTMPGYSGLDVIERLQVWRADLPIILVSGRGAILDQSDLGDARPDLILQKPIGMEALGAALQQILGAEDA